MLRVLQSNRLEELGAALADALPAGDPFAHPTVVASDRLVARWLQFDLARRRGIAGHLDLLYLEPFLVRAFTGDADARAAGLVALDRPRLAALLASALADDAIVAEPALAPVRGYLADDASRPVRRVQLADKIAGLLWDYALTRPLWLDAWDEGRDADTGEVDAATLAWQRRLYLAIRDPRRALVPRLAQARRALGLPTPTLPPAHVIGFSYLARAQLDALAAIAQRSDVHVSLVTPCAEFWEDVAGRRRAAVPASDDPLALSWWGAPGRDTTSMLITASDGDVSERHARPDDATALGAWARDLFDRTPASGARAEAGVTVLACPSLARELEIVGSTLWQLLADDPTLRASDVALLIAGDADRYLAQVGPVFGALHRLPFHVVDAPAASSGRVAEAAVQLLELPLGRFTRREMLALFTHPALLARHPHVEPTDWVRWCERLGIAHGADGGDHAGTYLAGAGAFHWAQGIERLALGAFVAGPRAGVDDPVDLGRLLLPEELTPEQEASASTFALLARSLVADARWLVDRAEPLARWAQILAAMVETYLGEVDPEDQASSARARVCDELAGLAELDLDDRPVPYREVVELARGRLASMREGRGEPLAQGVRVARLTPMRPIPTRATFIVGLAEGAFPAGDAPSPLDLRVLGKRGDVAPRDRNRYGFLEALLASRGPVYLSYVARNEQSGDVRAPSSVVHELAEMLTPYLGASSAADALARLTVAHPLRRWDERYIDDARLVASASPAAERERHAVVVRRSLDAHLASLEHAAPDAPALRELLASPSLEHLRRGLRLDLADGTARAPDDDAPVTLSLAVLRRFLEQPVQAWAQVVLGLETLDDDDGADREDEPFDDDPRDRAATLREAFADVLGGAEVDVAYGKVRRRRELAGHAPLGPFGAAASRRDRERLTRWREALATRGAAAGPWLRFAFGRAHQRGCELRPAIVLDAEVRGRRRRVELIGTTELCGGAAHERTVVLINNESVPEHQLRYAIDHLALAAAGVASGTRDGFVLGAAVERASLLPWSADDARAHLALLVGELLGAHHAYYLPLHTARTAQKGEPKRSSFHKDHPLGFGPLDRDPGLVIPVDAAAIATRRLGPIDARRVEVSEKPVKR